jgi:hexosaminidase
MKTLKFALIALVATACSPKASFDPSQLVVEWQLVRNNYDGNGNFLATMTFTNNSDGDMPIEASRIFFSLRYHSINLASKDATIEHINGELFTISGFALAAKESKRIEFTGARKVANFQDVPSGFFYVGKDDAAVAIERTIKRPTLDLPELVRTTVADIADPVKVLPTPTHYVKGRGSFTINKETTVSSDFDTKYLLDEIEKVTGYRLKPGNSIQIKKSHGVPESYTLSVTVNSITINSPDAAGAFYAIQSLKQLFPPDSWSSRHETIVVEAVEIRDQPRFPVREFMLDVGRNFESKQNVLRLLEVMSLYKMNTFHFHFNDDEGWRLEIPGLPELTDIGAARGYPYENNERLQPAYGSGPTEANHHGTGYYSRAEFIEILKYATERHIEVIPEIESPGHARAAIKAMEARYNRLMKEEKKYEAEQYLLHDVNDQSKYVSAQYFKDNAMNVASQSVYTFIEKVIVEMKKMYKEAGAPLTTVHMGGDEVADGAWEHSPSIDEYKNDHPPIKTPKDLYADFFVRTTALLKKHNLKITGWEEMIIEDPHIEATTRRVIDNKAYRADDLRFDAWWDIEGGYDMCYPIANAGYGVVLTCFDFFYFDLAQSPSFDEPGDAWIGWLPLQKTFSFNPYDIYNSSGVDMALRPVEADRYKDKTRLTALGKKNIRGLQGALWAENMTYDGYMEYQTLPRLLALAERAWAPEPDWARATGTRRAELFDSDWAMFVNKLRKRELPRLDNYNSGYKYRALH